MSRAARVMVNIDELNRAAGRELARLTGAEAGFVCSGAGRRTGVAGGRRNRRQ